MHRAPTMDGSITKPILKNYVAYLIEAVPNAIVPGGITIN